MSSKVERHGLSIGIERINNTCFATLKGIGTLTHEDYGIIAPMIDAALAGMEDPKLNMYCDMTELEGWEARAAWDDFKLGVKHGREFEKIAIVGNKRWLELGTKVGSWFMHGESKYFEDSDTALAWLHE